MEPITTTPQANGLRRSYVRILVIAVILIIGAFAFINQPSKAFPTSDFVTVKPGESMTAIANDLKAKHIIKSTILFKSMIVLSAAEQKLVAGDYYFKQPISTYGVVSRFVSGAFESTQVRVTIPEGITMQQMSKILAAKLPDFSTDDFMKYSPAKEGYLFPDTYFFKANSTADMVIDIMQKNFEDKIKTLEPAIATFGKSEKEVIIMASILEEEARTPEDWKIVSGILWKRIKIGMALQVDASLGYVTGKGSNELTTTDLKMESPYNTYTHKGLPPTPIASPGLETITAAINPTVTPYWYYLSDANGVIHYAATFADHIKNREKWTK